MAEFFIAVGAFLLAHMIPPIPTVRLSLIGLIGRRAYLIGYSILSLVLLAWVIVAARRAPYVTLWQPEPWQAWIPLIVMPVALWLLIGGLIEPNPLSISLRSSKEQEIRAMMRLTRHPVLWGFLLWALSHIPPNGDVVAMILFGGMAALAIGGFWIVDRRARRRLGDERWRPLSRSCPAVPFSSFNGDSLRGLASTQPLIAAVAAIVLYSWFLLQGHLLLIGMDPLSRL